AIYFPLKVNKPAPTSTSSESWCCVARSARVHAAGAARAARSQAEPGNETLRHAAPRMEAPFRAAPELPLHRECERVPILAPGVDESVADLRDTHAAPFD